MSDVSSAGSGPQERPAPRIGDRERHGAVDLLSSAFAEGQLTPEEFEERSSAALVARTEADLTALLVDLPAGRPAAPRATGRGDKRFVAVMSVVERKGRWEAGEEMTAVTVMGGSALDFRGAAVAGRRLSLRAVSVMGGIRVIHRPLRDALP